MLRLLLNHIGFFDLSSVIKEVRILASKCDFEGTSPITPLTIYRMVSVPILMVLSIGFSLPNILFAVDSDRTALCGALRRFFGSPLRTGIEKKLKKDESASIMCSSVNV